jgi:hypothetical protein
LKLFLVKLVLSVIYRTAPFVVIGEKMKMDHDSPNNHVGNGAKKKNDRNGGAGYLAALFGFSEMCEYAHPATYSPGRTQVM